MPEPISSNYRSEPNASFEPELTPTDSVSSRPESAPTSTSAETTASSLAVRPLVDRASLSSSPNGVRAGSTGVLLCKRVADIPLNEYTRFEHHFIVTDEKAAGAGHCGQGVPGHGQIDLPLSPMCFNDHSSEIGNPEVVCQLVEADPACVNRKLEFVGHLGPWAPPLNDCQTFAASVIAECSTAAANTEARAASGAEGARGY